MTLWGVKPVEGKKSLLSGGQLGRTRGLHDRQILQVAEFSREGAQPGAEGAPLLAVIFPARLQTRTQALAEAPETTPEMISDKAVEHGVDGRAGEAQAEGERGEVFDGPVYPAAVHPALASQHVQEGHAVEREPAEKEGNDHSSYCPQHPLQPPALQGSASTGAGAHARGRRPLWFAAALLGCKRGRTVKV